MTRKLLHPQRPDCKRGSDESTLSSACHKICNIPDNASTSPQHHHQDEGDRCTATLLTYTPKAKLRSHTIPAAHGFAFTPASGTHFRIIDLHGAQVVDFMAWCLPFSLASSCEHFSASYTRYNLGGSAPPDVGECLYSSWDRKMFEIVEDRVKCHDMLFMACNPSFYERKGKNRHRSCAGNVAEAMDEAGFRGDGAGEGGEGRKFEWWDVHDPFNVFQNTPYYSLKALENSRKGDFIEMKALMSCVVALSSCPYEEGGFNGGKVTDVAVVWEED